MTSTTSVVASTATCDILELLNFVGVPTAVLARDYEKLTWEAHVCNESALTAELYFRGNKWGIFDLKCEYSFVEVLPDGCAQFWNPEYRKLENMQYLKIRTGEAGLIQSMQLLALDAFQVLEHAWLISTPTVVLTEFTFEFGIVADSGTLLISACTATEYDTSSFRQGSIRFRARAEYHRRHSTVGS